MMFFGEMNLASHLRRMQVEFVNRINDMSRQELLREGVVDSLAKQYSICPIELKEEDRKAA
jgi:hypothetical protein